MKDIETLLNLYRYSTAKDYELEQKHEKYLKEKENGTEESYFDYIDRISQHGKTRGIFKCIEALSDNKQSIYKEMFDIFCEVRGWEKETGYGLWIPFEYAKNKNGDRVLTCEVPEDMQRILITVSLKDNEPVQSDTWHYDGYDCWLESGYTIKDEAIAWMPLPKKYDCEVE